MQNILRNIIRVFKKETYGLHIFIKDKEHFVFYLLLLSRESKGYKIIKKIQVSNIDELIGIINGATVSIYISGNGILLKHIENELQNDINIVKSLFGSIDNTSFFIQYNLVHKKKYISIVRKDLVKTILDLINRNCLIVQTSMIPPIEKSELESFINKNKLVFGSYELIYSEYLENVNTCVDNQYFDIGNQSISNDFLPSLYISQKNSYKKDLNNSIIEYTNYNKYKSYNTSNTIYFYSAIVIGLLIITNSILFSLYYSKVTNQQSQLSYNKSVLTQIKNLQDIKKKKETIINTQKLDKKVMYSYLINEIAKTTPKSISLTSFDIAPIIIRSNAIKHKRNEIQLKGVSYNGTGVTEFIQSIKNIEWVNTVKLLYYRKNYDAKNSDFQINIKTK